MDLNYYDQEIINLDKLADSEEISAEECLFKQLDLIYRKYNKK